MMVRGARRSLNDHDKCGDAFAWWSDDALWTICLVDGLGHGTEASLAAEAALVAAGTCRALSPSLMIGEVDRDIRWSRGAAMAVVQVDARQRSLCYAGVGNIRLALFGDQVRRFEGRPGIVGGGCKSPAPETLSWQDDDLLLFWTDGFGAYLDLDQPSRRLKGDPQALADRMIDRCSTRRDDAGIVCCLLEGLSP